MEMNRTVYKDVSEGLKVKSDKTEQPVQTGETAQVSQATAELHPTVFIIINQVHKKLALQQ